MNAYLLSKKSLIAIILCLLIASQSYAADTVVYVTSGGAKYHKEGCASLKKSKIKISKTDAVAKGYTACKKCLP